MEHGEGKQPLYFMKMRKYVFFSYNVAIILFSSVVLKSLCISGCFCQDLSRNYER